MILRFGYSFFVPSFISVHLVHLEYVLVVVCKSFFLFLVTILAAQRKQKTKIIRLHILVLTFSLSLSVVLFFRVLPLFLSIVLLSFFAPRIRTAGVVAMVAKLLKSEGVRDNTISN